MAAEPIDRGILGAYVLMKGGIYEEKVSELWGHET